jgi:hypothetical protein
LQHTLESNIQMRTQSHQSHRWLEWGILPSQ